MNVMIKVLVASASALLLLTMGSEVAHVQVLAQRESTKQFMVGILRADSTLVPFAEYKNGLWWNPWPEPTPYSENNEVTPKSLGNQPEPWFQQCERTSRKWYLWSSHNSSLELKALQTLQVENHSQTNWALLTDYPKNQNAGKGAHDYVGMALNVDLKVEGMVEIERGGNESNEIVAFVGSVFTQAENDEIARIRADATLSAFFATRGLPSASEKRASVELKITRLHGTKSSIDGARIYYVEVEKQYRKASGSPDSACNNIAFLKGWVLKGKDGTLALINDSFGFTDCDGKERGSSVELFSVLTLDRGTFVFTVEHGWEDESYTIYELKDSGLNRLLETFGG